MIDRSIPSMDICSMQVVYVLYVWIHMSLTRWARPAPQSSCYTLLLVLEKCDAMQWITCAKRLRYTRFDKCQCNQLGCMKKNPAERGASIVGRNVIDGHDTTTCPVVCMHMLDRSIRIPRISAATLNMLRCYCYDLTGHAGSLTSTTPMCVV